MTQTSGAPAAGSPPHDPFLPLEQTPFAPPRTSRLQALIRRLRADALGASGRRIRLSGRGMAVLVAVVGLIVVAATDQVVPASSAHQAQVRVWLASRAAGITALLLLAVQVLIGLVLSHPTNKTTWRLSRLIFPGHDTLWLFVLAFVLAHIVSIVIDPYAGVGLAGALVPGLSAYRSAPVALGTLALDALLVTGITARWSRLLPRGGWLVIHRAGAAVFLVAWAHGLLSGSDSAALMALYVAIGIAVIAATAHRIWSSGPVFEEVIAS